jgi:hypothetical protein
MVMNPHLLIPLLVAALLLWSLYWRVRRNFGRQTVSARRLYSRAAVLGVLGVLFLSVLWRDSKLLIMLLGGAACGAVLGQIGLRYTRFEMTPQGRFYTPHAYFGLVILALFVGRLLYRFLLIYAHPQEVAVAHGDPLALYRQSPLTLALFGLLVGYYVLYNLGVIRRARDLTGVAAL